MASDEDSRTPNIAPERIWAEMRGWPTVITDRFWHDCPADESDEDNGRDSLEAEFVHIDLYNAALDALRDLAEAFYRVTYEPERNSPEYQRARAVLAGESAPSFLDLPDTPPQDGTKAGPIPGPRVDFKD